MTALWEAVKRFHVPTLAGASDSNLSWGAANYHLPSTDACWGRHGQLFLHPGPARVNLVVLFFCNNLSPYTYPVYPPHTHKAISGVLSFTNWGMRTQAKEVGFGSPHTLLGYPRLLPTSHTWAPRI